MHARVLVLAVALLCATCAVVQAGDVPPCCSVGATSSCTVADCQLCVCLNGGGTPLPGCCSDTFSQECVDRASTVCNSVCNCVPEEAPIAGLGIVVEGDQDPSLPAYALGAPVHFTAEQTSETFGVTYTWAFSDGATLEGAAVERPMWGVGTLEATLTASNSLSSATISVDVHGTLPTDVDLMYAFDVQADTEHGGVEDRYQLCMIFNTETLQYDCSMYGGPYLAVAPHGSFSPMADTGLVLGQDVRGDWSATLTLEVQVDEASLDVEYSMSATFSDPAQEVVNVDYNPLSDPFCLDANSGWGSAGDALPLAFDVAERGGESVDEWMDMAGECTNCTDSVFEGVWRRSINQAELGVLSAFTNGMGKSLFVEVTAFPAANEEPFFKRGDPAGGDDGDDEEDEAEEETFFLHFYRVSEENMFIVFEKNAQVGVAQGNLDTPRPLGHLRNGAQQLSGVWSVPIWGQPRDITFCAGHDHKLGSVLHASLVFSEEKDGDAPMVIEGMDVTEPNAWVAAFNNAGDDGGDDEGGKDRSVAGYFGGMGSSQIVMFAHLPGLTIQYAVETDVHGEGQMCEMGFIVDPGFDLKRRAPMGKRGGCSTITVVHAADSAEDDDDCVVNSAWLLDGVYENDPATMSVCSDRHVTEVDNIYLHGSFISTTFGDVLGTVVSNGIAFEMEQASVMGAMFNYDTYLFPLRRRGASEALPIPAEPEKLGLLSFFNAVSFRLSGALLLVHPDLFGAQDAWFVGRVAIADGAPVLDAWTVINGELASVRFELTAEGVGAAALSCLPEERRLQGVYEGGLTVCMDGEGAVDAVVLADHDGLATLVGAVTSSPDAAHGVFVDSWGLDGSVDINLTARGTLNTTWATGEHMPFSVQWHRTSVFTTPADCGGVVGLQYPPMAVQLESDGVAMCIDTEHESTVVWWDQAPDYAPVVGNDGAFVRSVTKDGSFPFLSKVAAGAPYTITTWQWSPAPLYMALEGTPSRDVSALRDVLNKQAGARAARARRVLAGRPQHTAQSRGSDFGELMNFWWNVDTIDAVPAASMSVCAQGDNFFSGTWMANGTLVHLCVDGDVVLGGAADGVGTVARDLTVKGEFFEVALLTEGGLHIGSYQAAHYGDNAFDLVSVDDESKAIAFERMGSTPKLDLCLGESVWAGVWSSPLWAQGVLEDMVLCQMGQKVTGHIGEVLRVEGNVQDGIFTGAVLGGGHFYKQVMWRMHANHALIEDVSEAGAHTMPLDKRRSALAKARARSFMRRAAGVEPTEVTLDEESMEPRAVYAEEHKRIVEGDKTSTHDWPGVVLVYNSDYGSVCTGTLVAPQWVMTSLHCVNEENVDMVVLFGIDNVFDGFDDAHARHEWVEHIVRSPLAEEADVWYPTGEVGAGQDVVLLKLEHPVHDVEPVAVWDHGIDMEQLITPGAAARAVGYGATLGTSVDTVFPGDLQEVDTVLLPAGGYDLGWGEHADSAWAKIAAAFEWIAMTRSEWAHWMIGADAPDAPAGVCFGDSGGPLFGWDAHAHSWVQIGVTSRGSTFACGSGPDYYVSVAAHADWIHETIAEPGTFGELAPEVAPTFSRTGLVAPQHLAHETDGEDVELCGWTGESEAGWGGTWEASGMVAVEMEDEVRGAPVKMVPANFTLVMCDRGSSWDGAVVGRVLVEMDNMPAGEGLIEGHAEGNTLSARWYLSNEDKSKPSYVLARITAHNEAKFYVYEETVPLHAFYPFAMYEHEGGDKPAEEPSLSLAGTYDAQRVELPSAGNDAACVVDVTGTVAQDKDGFVGTWVATTNDDRFGERVMYVYIDTVLGLVHGTIGTLDAPFAILSGSASGGAVQTLTATLTEVDGRVGQTTMFLLSPTLVFASTSFTDGKTGQPLFASIMFNKVSSAVLPVEEAWAYNFLEFNTFGGAYSMMQSSHVNVWSEAAFCWSPSNEGLGTVSISTTEPNLDGLIDWLVETGFEEPGSPGHYVQYQAKYDAVDFSRTTARGETATHFVMVRAVSSDVVAVTMWPRKKEAKSEPVMFIMAAHTEFTDDRSCLPHGRELQGEFSYELMLGDDVFVTGKTYVCPNGDGTYDGVVLADEDQVNGDSFAFRAAVPLSGPGATSRMRWVPARGEQVNRGMSIYANDGEHHLDTVVVSTAEENEVDIAVPTPEGMFVIGHGLQESIFATEAQCRSRGKGPLQGVWELDASGRTFAVCVDTFGHEIMGNNNLDAWMPGGEWPAMTDDAFPSLPFVQVHELNEHGMPMTPLPLHVEALSQDAKMVAFHTGGANGTDMTLHVTKEDGEAFAAWESREGKAAPTTWSDAVRVAAWHSVCDVGSMEFEGDWVAADGSDATLTLCASDREVAMGSLWSSDLSGTVYMGTHEAEIGMTGFVVGAMQRALFHVAVIGEDTLAAYALVNGHTEVQMVFVRASHAVEQTKRCHYMVDQFAMEVWIANVLSGGKLEEVSFETAEDGTYYKKMHGSEGKATLCQSGPSYSGHMLDAYGVVRSQSGEQFKLVGMTEEQAMNDMSFFQALEEFGLAEGAYGALYMFAYGGVVSAAEEDAGVWFARPSSDLEIYTMHVSVYLASGEVVELYMGPNWESMAPTWPYDPQCVLDATPLDGQYYLDVVVEGDMLYPFVMQVCSRDDGEVSGLVSYYGLFEHDDDEPWGNDDDDEVEGDFGSDVDAGDAAAFFSALDAEAREALTASLHLLDSIDIHAASKMARKVVAHHASVKAPTGGEAMKKKDKGDEEAKKMQESLHHARKAVHEARKARMAEAKEQEHAHAKRDGHDVLPEAANFDVALLQKLGSVRGVRTPDGSVFLVGVNTWLGLYAMELDANLEGTLLMATPQAIMAHGSFAAWLEANVESAGQPVHLLRYSGRPLQGFCGALAAQDDSSVGGHLATFFGSLSVATCETEVPEMGTGVAYDLWGVTTDNWWGFHSGFQGVAMNGQVIVWDEVGQIIDVMVKVAGDDGWFLVGMEGLFLFPQAPLESVTDCVVPVDRMGGVWADRDEGDVSYVCNTPREPYAMMSHALGKAQEGAVLREALVFSLPYTKTVVVEGTWAMPGNTFGTYLMYLEENGNAIHGILMHEVQPINDELGFDSFDDADKEEQERMLARKVERVRSAHAKRSGHGGDEGEPEHEHEHDSFEMPFVLDRVTLEQPHDLCVLAGAPLPAGVYQAGVSMVSINEDDDDMEDDEESGSGESSGESSGVESGDDESSDSGDSGASDESSVEGKRWAFEESDDDAGSDDAGSDDGSGSDDSSDIGSDDSSDVGSDSDSESDSDSDPVNEMFGYTRFITKDTVLQRFEDGSHARLTRMGMVTFTGIHYTTDGGMQSVLMRLGADGLVSVAASGATSTQEVTPADAPMRAGKQLASGVFVNGKGDLVLASAVTVAGGNAGEWAAHMFVDGHVLDVYDLTYDAVNGTAHAHGMALSAAGELVEMDVVFGDDWATVNDGEVLMFVAVAPDAYAFVPSAEHVVASSGSLEGRFVMPSVRIEMCETADRVYGSVYVSSKYELGTGQIDGMLKLGDETTAYATLETEVSEFLPSGEVDTEWNESYMLMRVVSPYMVMVVDVSPDGEVEPMPIWRSYGKPTEAECLSAGVNGTAPLPSTVMLADVEMYSHGDAVVSSTMVKVTWDAFLGDVFYYTAELLAFSLDDEDEQMLEPLALELTDLTTEAHFEIEGATWYRVRVCAVTWGKNLHGCTLSEVFVNDLSPPVFVDDALDGSQGTDVSKQGSEVDVDVVFTAYDDESEVVWVGLAVAPIEGGAVVESALSAEVTASFAVVETDDDEVTFHAWATLAEAMESEKEYAVRVRIGSPGGYSTAWTDGFEVGTQQVFVDPTQNVTLASTVSLGGNLTAVMSLSIPSGAVDIPVSVEIGAAVYTPGAANDPTTNAPSGATLFGGLTFEINGFSENGTALDTVVFAEPVGLTVEVPGAADLDDPENLDLYLFIDGEFIRTSDTCGEGEAPPTSYDAATQSLTAYLCHLTQFAVFHQPPPEPTPTPSPSPTATPKPKKDDDGFTGGKVIGAIVGAFLGVALVVFLIIRRNHRNERRRRDELAQQEQYGVTTV